MTDYADLCMALRTRALAADAVRHQPYAKTLRDAAAAIETLMAERETANRLIVSLGKSPLNVEEVEQLQQRAERSEAERDAARDLLRCFMGDFDVLDVSDETYDIIEKRARELWQVVEERDALRAKLPDVPKIERECKTLDDWRMRALYLESQWSGCSRACAAIQDRAERAEAQCADLNKTIESLNEAHRESCEAYERAVMRAGKAEAERDTLQAERETANRLIVSLGKSPLNVEEVEALQARIEELEKFQREGWQEVYAEPAIKTYKEAAEKAEAERDALREKLDKLCWELSPDATEEQKREFELSRRCVGVRSGTTR